MVRLGVPFANRYEARRAWRARVGGPTPLPFLERAASRTLQLAREVRIARWYAARLFDSLAAELGRYGATSILVMRRSHIRQHVARQIWIPLLWLGGFALALDGRRDTLDSLRRAYGANWPGDFSGAFVQLTIESAILYVILHPPSYRHSWKRCIVAFALFLPWTLIEMLVIMHTGKIWHAVWLWNVLLLPMLCLAAIVSLLTEHASRFRAPAT